MRVEKARERFGRASGGHELKTEKYKFEAVTTLFNHQASSDSPIVLNPRARSGQTTPLSSPRPQRGPRLLLPEVFMG